MLSTSTSKQIRKTQHLVGVSAGRQSHQVCINKQARNDAQAASKLQMVYKEKEICSLWPRLALPIEHSSLTPLTVNPKCPKNLNVQN